MEAEIDNEPHSNKIDTQTILIRREYSSYGAAVERAVVKTAVVVVVTVVTVASVKVCISCVNYVSPR